jgi:SAM-dependent methyltransferase
MLVVVCFVPPDYDTDPERWASRDPSWLVSGDTHEVVAERLVREALRPVLDVGCGEGRLGELLPDDWSWIGVDSSAVQLENRRMDTVVRADAVRLPFRDASFAAVTALWMLYHLERPIAAIQEARRVLRPGGLFIACTNSRTNDPELVPDGYPPTTFDAEDAPSILASVFGELPVGGVAWDAPLVRLRDQNDVARYLRSHHLPADMAKRVEAPLTLTKRGCLVLARKPG